MLRYTILAFICGMAGNMLPAQPSLFFRVQVCHKLDRSPITAVETKLTDLSTFRTYKTVSDDSGFCDFKLTAATRYRLEITGTGTGYMGFSYILTEKEISQQKVFVAELEKITHNHSGLLPATSFDYNSANLNASNENALKKLEEILTGFPAMQIEIGIYADCRENEQLVHRRAQAIKNYYAERNLNTQITIKEYGHLRPLNQCNCLLETPLCTEEKYAENRRAEFKVIAF